MINKNPAIPEMSIINRKIPITPKPHFAASSLCNDFPQYGHVLEYGMVLPQYGQE